MFDDFRASLATTFLDTAGYGLPPHGCTQAIRQALTAWEKGTASWQDEWEPAAERCRQLFAAIIHAPSDEIAVLPAVSLATAIIASAVPRGGEVLVEAGEFRSIVFPFLVAERRGLLRVREVAPGTLPDEITHQTTMVALSHVQSADGRLADVSAVVDAAQAADALVYLDATHSAGTMPINIRGLGVDFMSCAAYKWLCCPRGVAFLWSKRELRDRLSPIAAGWRAASDHRDGGYYGGPLDLADGAARFDLSIAWHAWIGAAASLKAITQIPEETRFARGHGLACVLARTLGLRPPQSTILIVPLRTAELARRTLTERRLKVTVQRHGVRVSPHFYNTPTDIDHAAEVLLPLLSTRGAI